MDSRLVVMGTGEGAEELLLGGDRVSVLGDESHHECA
jgi:hypothetical protein